MEDTYSFVKLWLTLLIGGGISVLQDIVKQILEANHPMVVFLYRNIPDATLEVCGSRQFADRKIDLILSREGKRAALLRDG